MRALGDSALDQLQRRAEPERGSRAQRRRDWHCVCDVHRHMARQADACRCSSAIAAAVFQTLKRQDAFRFCACNFFAVCALALAHDSLCERLRHMLLCLTSSSSFKASIFHTWSHANAEPVMRSGTWSSVLLIPACMPQDAQTMQHSQIRIPPKRTECSGIRTISNRYECQCRNCVCIHERQHGMTQ